MIEHTVLLHDSQELDDDLGARSDQDLALACLLGVVDGLERIVENGSTSHLGGIDVSRFSLAICAREVSVLIEFGQSSAAPWAKKKCPSLQMGFFSSPSIGRTVSPPTMRLRAIALPC